jgi:hypothetical protein
VLREFQSAETVYLQGQTVETLTQLTATSARSKPGPVDVQGFKVAPPRKVRAASANRNERSKGRMLAIGLQKRPTAATFKIPRYQSVDERGHKAVAGTNRVNDFSAGSGDPAAAICVCKDRAALPQRYRDETGPQFEDVVENSVGTFTFGIQMSSILEAEFDDVGFAEEWFEPFPRLLAWKKC